MDELSGLYQAHERSSGTHLALSWKDRVRFTVPREGAAQSACWKLFKPGKLGIPMRVQAALPLLPGAQSCVESEKLLLIRDTIGTDAGLSCCRAGAPGPWYKDTILLLDKSAEPLFIVKAGAGEAVNGLLSNEAKWLENLRNEPSLACHVSDLVAHRAATDLCFVAQRPFSGKQDSTLGKLQVEFLRKLQRFRPKQTLLEESRFYQNLLTRLHYLDSLMSSAWSARIKLAMRKIEMSLSGSRILVVAAHNDFTPWNVRLGQDIARVFDWEYADYEQLPLFDPLHFTLIQMVLGNCQTLKMTQRIREALPYWKRSFGEEHCYEPEAQVLAYLLNVCTLYLTSIEGKCDSHHVLDRFALLIDSVCRE